MKRRITVLLVVALLAVVPVAGVVTSEISYEHANQLCCYAKPALVQATDHWYPILLGASQVEFFGLLVLLTVGLISFALRRMYRAYR